MTTNLFGRLFQSLTVAVLLGSASARADVGGLRDNAGFFSDSARSEASRNIAEIEKRFKKDLVIETFKEVPEDVKKGVDLQDKAALNKMFDQWAVKQAKQERVNGVYVLLSKEPAHLQIVVGNDTQSRAFTLRDRDTLTGIMLSKLRNKENDGALLDGVNFVSATMAGHATAGNRSSTVPARTAYAQPNGHSGGSGMGIWSWVIIAVIGLGAMMLIMGVIRAIFSGGSPGMGGGMAPTGGGGFMSSLLGGMFGAAAGMWIYDQFSGHNSSNSNYDVDSRRNDEGYSGQDSDYSSSGGDFGGSDSGSDFGGGDSGGDSGGGDSGGGGDF